MIPIIMQKPIEKLMVLGSHLVVWVGRLCSFIWSGWHYFWMPGWLDSSSLPLASGVVAQVKIIKIFHLLFTGIALKLISKDQIVYWSNVAIIPIRQLEWSFQVLKLIVEFHVFISSQLEWLSKISFP